MQQDNRADLRSPIPLTPVTAGEGTGRYFGDAMNISRSGMFIRTFAFPNVGEVVEIKFTLPRTDITIQCQSEVIWNRCLSPRHGGMTFGGYRFLDIPPDVAEKLSSYVNAKGSI